MSKNKQATIQAALQMVREEMADLGTKIRNSEPGAERDQLEAEMRKLMDSIGLEYVSNPDLKPADGTESAPETAAAAKLTTEAPPPSSTDVINAKVASQSLWQRAKQLYQNNVKKFWAGVAVVIAGGAGLVYYMKNKDSAAVSSVSSLTRSIQDVDVTADTTADAGASIFARIGAWIVSAGQATKTFFVDGYVKLSTWVKGLFNKSTTETTDAMPDVAPEVIPA